MINGILNVYKEKGYTSHDVIAKLRGICRQKKIGHTGTLDPDAEGVLPVCLGNATKLVDLLTDKSKVYEAELILGITTDTQDISGTVVSEKEVNAALEEVKGVILSFIGEYDQIPPMYSAIKVNGRKLYELAREGKTIERQPRRVSITDISIMGMELPKVFLKVSCSKGTYIRTLCHDIGEKLGCGGVMGRLTRTRVGDYLCEEAFTLSQIEEFRDAGILESKIASVESFFSMYPKASTLESCKKFIDNGNPLLPEHLAEYPQLSEGEKICIYSHDGIFKGIYENSGNRNMLNPVKMFPTL